MDKKIAARTGNGDDVVSKLVSRFIESEKELVVDPLGIVGVVVVDNQRHAHQGPERLCDDVRGNEMAVEDVRAVRKKERRECGEIQREMFFRRKRVDIDSSLAQPIPINPVTMHRGDFVPEASAAAGGEIQNDLLCSAEVQTVDDMENSFHGAGWRALHCCQIYSHQR